MVQESFFADYDKTELSGQTVLPGFQAVLECEAAALNNPRHETFCVKYVEFAGDSAKAWQAVNPETPVARLAAQKNAHKLLKRGEIRRRINEISAVTRNRDLNRVLSLHRSGVEFDPADYFDPETGCKIPVHKLPEEKRRGVGLEARVVDGCLVYAPVFPNPQKSAEALAKVMGFDKQVVELTGKDGGPLEHRHGVDDSVLEAIALGKA
jgi:hypothetical protein